MGELFFEVRFWSRFGPLEGLSLGPGNTQKAALKNSKGTRKSRKQGNLLAAVLHPFWYLGRLLALSRSTFLLSCRPLIPGAEKGIPKSSPGRVKRFPRAAQERPRATPGMPKRGQESPGDPNRGPRKLQESAREQRKKLTAKSLRGAAGVAQRVDPAAPRQRRAAMPF